MSDRELIRLAAKAAGVDGPQVQGFDGIVIGNERDGHIFWNPLTDDGDALRLAVKLGITVFQRQRTTYCEWLTGELTGEINTQFHGTDPYAATRRAIVRAAASIGENNGN